MKKIIICFILLTATVASFAAQTNTTCLKMKDTNERNNPKAKENAKTKNTTLPLIPAGVVTQQ